MFDTPVRWFFRIFICLFFTVSLSHNTDAKVISLDGSKVWLDSPDNPTASIVLMPGGGGLSENDPLQRLRKKLAAEGFAVLSVDKKTNIRAAMRRMSEEAKPVYLAAVSQGVMKVGGMLSTGQFKIKKLVLIAGDLKFVQKKVGDPDKLPLTLVLHHRYDRCKKTPPSSVKAFKKWAGNKVKVIWLKGGKNNGNPCGPDSFHGLAGLDGQTVSAITDFLQ